MSTLKIVSLSHIIEKAKQEQISNEYKVSEKRISNECLQGFRKIRKSSAVFFICHYYSGTHNNVIGTPWVFGQHESTVLPACCFLLDNSGLNSWERGDPVKVARALSAMINQNDDDGVMVGRLENINENVTTQLSPLVTAVIFQMGGSI